MQAPDKLMAQAARLQGEGRLAEAEQALQQILQQQPDHAFALHLQGVIACQTGKLPAAAELVKEAIRLKPDVGLFHANLCEIYRQLGQLDLAIEHGQRATRLEPRMAMAHCNLGVVYSARGDYAQAEQCQRRALAQDSNFAQAMNSMGCVKRAQGQHEAAQRWFERAVAARPAYLEPLNNLAALLLETDQPTVAETTITQALRLAPNHPDVLCNQGAILVGHDAFAAALVCFERVLALRPNHPKARQGRARALLGLERRREALQEARLALAATPDNAEAHALLASICAQSELDAEARHHYEQAVTLAPNCSSAILGLGYHYMEAGDMAGAEALFRRALVQKPEDMAAHIHLTHLNRITSGDPSLAALLAQEMSIDRLSPSKAINLEFALGKALDDSGDYDAAFARFLEGGRRKRQQLQYDAAATDKLFASLMQTFSRDYVDGLRGAGLSSALPIFVLGMPRSGTTLTEQILASHPLVYGRGERDELLDIIKQKRSVGGTLKHFPNNLQGLDRTTLLSWGREYMASIRLPDAPYARATDKMPANFFALPLIHLMLPKAKVIHVRRHPVDTCFSCFSTLFRTKQEYSYELAELGRYYANYLRLMQHWREILPANAFMEIRYEDIVAEPEASARRLLEFCGLDWDPACLNFHQNRATVRTASLAQVRQPIYHSSVQRWRHYEKHLGPLLEALGDYE